MGFSEVELIESLVRFEGYDLNEQQLTELLISDEDNLVQRLHIGFMFVVNNISEELNITFLRVINDIVSEHKLFYYSIEKEQQFLSLFSIEDPVSLIIQLYLFITKEHLFEDGREVTALLFISAVLIQCQVGVLKVPKSLYDTFIDLVETDHEILAEFITRFCLDTSLFS